MAAAGLWGNSWLGLSWKQKLRAAPRTGASGGGEREQPSSCLAFGQQDLRLGLAAGSPLTGSNYRPPSLARRREETCARPPVGADREWERLPRREAQEAASKSKSFCVGGEAQGQKKPCAPPPPRSSWSGPGGSLGTGTESLLWALPPVSRTPQPPGILGPSG